MTDQSLTPPAQDAHICPACGYPNSVIEVVERDTTEGVFWTCCSCGEETSLKLWASEPWDKWA